MIVTDADEIAKAIESERTKQGVSKNLLARKAGISRPTVLNMIKIDSTGRNSYDVRNLLKVLDVLDLQLKIL